MSFAKQIPLIAIAAFILAVFILAALIVARPGLPEFDIAIVETGVVEQNLTAQLYQDNDYGFSVDQSIMVLVANNVDEAKRIFSFKPSPFYFVVPSVRGSMPLRVELTGGACPPQASLYLRSKDGVTRTVPLERAGAPCLWQPPGRKLDLSPFLIYFHPLILFIQALIAIGLARIIMLLPVLWRNRQRVLRSDFTRRFVPCFAGFLVWYLLWVWAAWPGYMGEDSFPVMEQAVRLHLTSWFSIIYPAFVLAVQQIGGSFAVLGIFIAMLTAGLVAWCFANVVRYRVPPWLTLLTLGFFALSPVVLTYLSFMTRDVIAGLDNCALLVFTFFTVTAIRYRRHRLTKKDVVTFLTLAFISAAIRLENCLTAAAAGGMLYAFAKQDRVRLRKPFAGFALVILAWQMVVTPLVTGDSRELRNGYTLNPLLNPMGGMVHDDYVTDTPDEDLAAVGNVVDPTIYKQHWHIYGLSYFKWPTTATDEQLRDFRRVMVKSILHNPELYVGRRAELFASIMGCPHTWFFTDYSQGGRIGDLKNDRVYRDRPSEFYDLAIEYLSSPILSWQRGDSLWSYAWSAWAQLLIVLGVFFFRTRLPVAGWIAGCMLARLTCLFLLAPAAHFFYVYDLVLFGAWLPSLAWVEAVQRPRRSA